MLTAEIPGVPVSTIVKRVLVLRSMSENNRGVIAMMFTVRYDELSASSEIEGVEAAV